MYCKKFTNMIEADYLERIEIWWLKANNWLQPGIDYHSVSWNRNNLEAFSIGIRIIIVPNNQFVELLYKLVGPDGKKIQVDTQVKLLKTKCNYGGTRYWFECPSCYERVGVLYYRGGYFACRQCQHLTYVSKKVNGVEKITGRIISNKELETLRLRVKRKFYNGKATKIYTRYVKKLMRQKRTMTALYGQLL